MHQPPAAPARPGPRPLRRSRRRGSFAAPPRPTGPNEQLPLYKQLPTFCRVKIQATPTPDSNIQIEVWLPAADWNNRLQGIGNGGFAGEIDFEGLARSLANNNATAGTDTGHFADGIDASWALHHPEKITDYGWRGIHQMTAQAKAVLAAYYGAPAKHSYFTSCSDGGREALMEAQRFPGDYDGILAGAPAYNWTTLLTSAAIGMQTLLTDNASYIPATDVPLIHRAIVANCDKRDGVKDGIIADPPACHFDAAKLACKSGHTQNCLTAAQVKSLSAILAEHKVGDTTIPADPSRRRRTRSQRLAQLDHRPGTRQVRHGRLRLRLLRQHGLRRSQVELPHLRSRRRSRRRARKDQRSARRHQSRSQCLPRSAAAS